MPKDYSKTLNLPATTFEMRANLPVREEAKFKEWLDNGLYADLIKHNEGKPLFTFHDGPPYANGDIHTGHALNKILKDFIVRYKNMSGFLTHYIHGWDTHGLPIENKVKDAKKVDRNIIGDLAYRELCREFALGFFSSMKSQMQRLGVLGDWDRSYLTLKPEFESEQIRVFGKMFGKGCIYKGLKPVYWCAAHETALAEAEIEYSDDECDSIYVKFPLKDDKGLLSRYTGGTLDNVSVVIWTTTTWTLPANLAVCVGPEFEYSVVKVSEGEKSGEVYILASELAASVLKIAGVSGYEVLTKIKGSEMEYMKCLHPFFDRESLVIVGNHVSLDSGTGCVHTAPGHGVEDFNICKNYKEIPVIVPVDSKGFMTEDAGKYKGLKTSQANVAILEDIKASGALLATEKIVHQYPHCWRCKTPILFRATEQWFCSVDDFKEDALKAVKGVKWYPPWGGSTHRKYGKGSRRLVHLASEGMGCADTCILLRKMRSL
ncbi:hypothetical protein FACS1894105_05100 [Clostridia bacterium]|nr:hypothetical protein FACS1894105_05100 [Clostridia bacterium]